MAEPLGGGASGAAAPSAGEDVCLPFLVHGGAFRGRLVRLVSSATEILERHGDPEPVSILLAEAMAASVALATGLKFKGVFSLQIQGKGPVTTIVTDVTDNCDVRAWAKFDAEALAVEMTRARPQGSVPRLMGAGAHLAFTVDQGPDKDRYQGIVELTGESLAEAVHHYFRQSEQLESALKVAVAPPQSPGAPWVAGALLLQRMPEEGGVRIASKEDQEDAWRTAVILAGSLKDSELLDLTLTPERLLTRLFVTMGVAPSIRKPIHAKCRCSRVRSQGILASFPMDELRSYAEDGAVHMTCEFCRTDYAFTLEELETIVARHRGSAEKEPSP